MSPLMFEDRRLHLTAVGMGNPHVVTFDNVTMAEVLNLGPILEHHGISRPAWTRWVRDDGGRVTSLAPVWERGAGLTGACGSGACAAVMAACVTSRGGYRTDTVEQPGGPLTQSR